MPLRPSYITGSTAVNVCKLSIRALQGFLYETVGLSIVLLFELTGQLHRCRKTNMLIREKNREGAKIYPFIYPRLIQGVPNCRFSILAVARFSIGELIGKSSYRGA